MSLMNFGMARFFVVFSFFKLLDIRAFADAYGSYDIIAKRFHAYGYIYPFIRLTLGIYFMAFATLATNIANFAVLSLSTIGVARILLKKTKIQCAYLGTVFNLPMSSVTLIEELFMVGMSATMIGAISMCWPDLFSELARASSPNLGFRVGQFLWREEAWCDWAASFGHTDLR
jgi:methylamine utilization protein MauE